MKTTFWATMSGLMLLAAGVEARPASKRPLPAAAQVTPVVVASEQREARLLAQDSKSVFWVSAEGVMRADKSAGSPRKLYEATDVADLAVVRDTVYWLEQHAVMKAPSRGGAVDVLAKDRTQPERLAADPAAAYWSEWRENGPALVSMRRMGSEVGELMFPDAMPQHLVADGASLYFTDFNGSVQRVGKFGGPPDILATDAFAPAGRLAIDSRYVYWTNPSGELVQRVSREGGKPTVLSKGGGVPAAVALEDQNVLFALNDERAQTYRVMRVPKRGGKARQLVKAEGKITELLLDGRTLYWIEDADAGRRIMKAALPK